MTTTLIQVLAVASILPLMIIIPAIHAILEDRKQNRKQISKQKKVKGKK